MSAVRDARFPAMGTECHIRVVGDVDPALGRAEVERLQRLWTRFEPSEVTSLTATPTRVDPDTALLLRRAIEGYDLTQGLFNPFLVEQIEAAGYDRDFDTLGEVTARPARSGQRPQVSIDGNTVSTSLPLDSGGLGKGLAADLVAERLIEAGADGALVNLGGDLRCLGTPARDSWQVGIEVPVQLNQPLSVRLREGAVCTSTPLLRRWTLVTGGQAHHLLDPRTGAPLRTDLASVSVIAPQAWLAEVLSKAVFLLPTDRSLELLGACDAAALLVARDGQLRRLG